MVRRYLTTTTVAAVSAIVLALLRCMSPASAQTVPPPRLHPCTGLPITGPPYYSDYDAAQALVCTSSTLPWVDFNAAGIIGWRYCKANSGAYFAQWAVVPWDDLKRQPALATELLAAGLRTSDAGLLAITNKYNALIKPLADPENAAVWCPMWPKIAANMPAPTPPPALTHVVAANAPATNRPTYLVLASGRRSPTVNGQVPVGTPCDVTNAVREPPRVFGYAIGAPPRSVTLCVPRP